MGEGGGGQMIKVVHYMTITTAPNKILKHFACLLILQVFFLLFFSSNFNLKKNRSNIRVSNSLDKDQARHFVGPNNKFRSVIRL